jgi:hypothetical protein
MGRLMKIVNIALDDEGDPAEVTAKISLAEAVYLTKLLGGMRTPAAEVICPQGGDSNHSIADTLDQLLLKFWPEGVADAEGKLL